MPHDKTAPYYMELAADLARAQASMPTVAVAQRHKVQDRLDLARGLLFKLATESHRVHRSDVDWGKCPREPCAGVARLLKEIQS